MLESVGIVALVGLGSYAISSLGIAKKEKKKAEKAKAEAEQKKTEVAEQQQVLQEAATAVLNATTTGGWSLVNENGEKVSIPKFTIVKDN